MGKATKASGCMGRSLNVSCSGATSFNKATKMVLFDMGATNMIRRQRHSGFYLNFPCLGAILYD